MITITGNGTAARELAAQPVATEVVSSVPPQRCPPRPARDDARREVGAVVEQDVGGGVDHGRHVRVMLVEGVVARGRSTVMPDARR